ncbi:MAG: cbb3-type cytochrome oxidase subunit 3 [Candidatus Binatia bacterium]
MLPMWMDPGVIRGIGTLILFLSFVALCVWAWAPAQRRRFDDAARLPLLDDGVSPELKVGRKPQ